MLWWEIGLPKKFQGIYVIHSECHVQLSMRGSYTLVQVHNNDFISLEKHVECGRGGIIFKVIKAVEYVNMTRVCSSSKIRDTSKMVNVAYHWVRDQECCRFIGHVLVNEDAHKTHKRYALVRFG